MPSRVDVTYAAPLPTACPDCGGAIRRTRVAPQYQEDLPAVRPIVWRFDVHVGCCVACGRRVQGRFTSVADVRRVRGANVHLGPRAVTLVVLLTNTSACRSKRLRRCCAIASVLRVTPGGLAHTLHRAARMATPAYGALCARDPRESHVVSPDETGWRVGAVLHWLWAFATPATTVYAICPGRGS